MIEFLIITDCETLCVQVHSSLSGVSESIRNLLLKHQIFKTSQVIIPASQLVHNVKSISRRNFVFWIKLKPISRYKLRVHFHRLCEQSSSYRWKSYTTSGISKKDFLTQQLLFSERLENSIASAIRSSMLFVSFLSVIYNKAKVRLWSFLRPNVYKNINVGWMKKTTTL